MPDYEASPDELRRLRTPRTLVTMLIVVVVIVVCGGALMIPAIQSAREAARVNNCICRLKQIGTALHNYHDLCGSLPPAYTVDASGNRLHSWRTLILPYLEEQALYASIDLTKPWDHPANAKARATALTFYQCPSATLDEFETTYLAIVGPRAAFNGSTARRFSGVTDGTSKTIAVVDAPVAHAVHWMAPVDVSPAQVVASRTKVSPQHSGAMPVMFLDAHVTSLALDLDPNVLQALLTATAGDALPATADW